MPIKTATAGNFFVVRWGHATRANCAQIISELDALRREQSKPILYLGIMPADMPSIDEEGRDALMKLTTALVDRTALAVVAMEARGFAGAAMRGLMSGIMLLSGVKGRVKFVDSVESALNDSKHLHPADKRPMREAIIKVGGAAPVVF